MSIVGNNDKDLTYLFLRVDYMCDIAFTTSVLAGATNEKPSRVIKKKVRTRTPRTYPFGIVCMSTVLLLLNLLRDILAHIHEKKTLDIWLKIEDVGETKKIVLATTEQLKGE